MSLSWRANGMAVIGLREGGAIVTEISDAA